MSTLERRAFLKTAAAASSVGLLGCAAACPVPERPSKPTEGGAEPGGGSSLDTASKQPFEWTEEEQPLITADRNDFQVVVRGCSDTTVLRRRARQVPPGTDLTEVSRRMAETMKVAGGVGIAGPQVGLSLRVATLMLDYKTDDPRTIFVANPLILERSDETLEGYEGCLSIPDVGGKVRRSKWIRVSYMAESGEMMEVEATGPNAVLWQHELDHLDGVLYIDRLLGELMPMEEVRRLRKIEYEKSKKTSGRRLGDGDWKMAMEGSLLGGGDEEV